MEGAPFIYNKVDIADLAAKHVGEVLFTDPPNKDFPNASMRVQIKLNLKKTTITGGFLWTR